MRAKRLTIYLSESDTRRGRPIFELIVQLAHQRGLGGATVVRGFLGFGAGRKIHTAHPDLASKLPVRVELVDTPEAIDAILPDVYDLVEGGLIELSEVDLVRGSTRAPSPPPTHHALAGQARMLRIFVGLHAKREGRPLHEALLERLRQLDVAGATVLPDEGAIEIIVVDTAEKLAPVQALLDEWRANGTVHESDVEVVFYR
jgi:PII-like signaling protein